VTFQDWVSKETAHALIANADLLLLLAQDQPEQVPNKLYDYLGARRPILAFADQEGESASMLREIGGHYLVYTDDPLEVERALEAALTRSPPAGTACTADSKLEEWTTERQMRHLLARIGALEAGGTLHPATPPGVHS
jgi:hypothetical protein